ncbi:MAG: hemolysin III family protein [Spirochaetales bacterium]|nr:hemolysin III family protein [Spirochaetales bacterium]
MSKNFKEFILKKIDLPSHYSENEERFNWVSHFVGVCFSLSAFVYMLIHTLVSTEIAFSWSMTIFMLTMTAMYSFSTLYHKQKDEFKKKLLRVCDHTSIYLLIAGTYTPIAAALDSSKTYVILGIIWSFAIIGIVVTMIFWGKFKVFHLFSYLIMGWTVVLFWGDITPLMSTGLLVSMIVGGLLYTLGTILYSMKIPYSHGVWHLFVLSASISFFVGIVGFL